MRLQRMVLENEVMKIRKSIRLHEQAIAIMTSSPTTQPTCPQPQSPQEWTKGLDETKADLARLREKLGESYGAIRHREEGIEAMNQKVRLVDQERRDALRRLMQTEMGGSVQLR